MSKKNKSPAAFMISVDADDLAERVRFAAGQAASVAFPGESRRGAYHKIAIKRALAAIDAAFSDGRLEQYAREVVGRIAQRIAVHAVESFISDLLDRRGDQRLETDRTRMRDLSEHFDAAGRRKWFDATIVGRKGATRESARASERALMLFQPLTDKTLPAWTAIAAAKRSGSRRWRSIALTQLSAIESSELRDRAKQIIDEISAGRIVKPQAKKLAMRLSFLVLQSRGLLAGVPEGERSIAHLYQESTLFVRRLKEAIAQSASALRDVPGGSGGGAAVDPLVELMALGRLSENVESNDD